mgnify:CR=1 FL=1
MKKLFGYADEYIRKSDWKDMALVKFCLMSIGLMIGMFVPKGEEKVGSAHSGSGFCPHICTLDEQIF